MQANRKLARESLFRRLAINVWVLRVNPDEPTYVTPPVDPLDGLFGPKVGGKLVAEASKRIAEAREVLEVNRNRLQVLWDAAGERARSCCRGIKRTDLYIVAPLKVGDLVLIDKHYLPPIKGNTNIDDLKVRTLERDY